MGETTTNFLIGLLCVILGILIHIIYYRQKKEKDPISFHFQNVGNILIIIGIGLIVRAIRK